MRDTTTYKAFQEMLRKGYKAGRGMGCTRAVEEVRKKHWPLDTHDRSVRIEFTALRLLAWIFNEELKDERERKQANLPTD